MTPLNIRSLRALILDMDGVIWRGQEPIGNLPQIFATIQQRGLGVVMATNNSTKTPVQYIQRMAGYGVSLEPWQVVNSSEATAAYLREKFPAGGAVYIVGEGGLFSTLEAHGFYHSETEALAVVAGLDKKLSYEKLMQANAFIRAGAIFVGTNPDRTFPTPDGQVPGAGVMLAAIEAASYVAPLIAGKPQTGMYALALQRLGVSAAETLVVGDRLETDIAGGQNIGAPTALVLSGVTTRAQAEKWQPAPDLIADDLTALLAMLTED
ncbi:MAG: HAD-IIA family hydrolase [Chloroflexi bacterium]|nr:HAD-IIA family hydrolase [Chloroflexota bacterium]